MTDPRQVRLFPDGMTERDYFRVKGQLMREIREAWTDGCCCQLCSWLDLAEQGKKSWPSYTRLIELAMECGVTRHADGVWQ